MSKFAKVGTTQLSAVSKEQLYNMLSKTQARYHKTCLVRYLKTLIMLICVDARYADLAKAYRQIQLENQKVKEVMQQTQDKALR